MRCFCRDSHLTDNFGSYDNMRAMKPITTVNPITITANWDPEARVWVAESEQIPLVTEASTIPALLDKLPGIIADLLGDDGRFAPGDEVEVPFELVAHRHERVRVRVRRIWR